MVPAWSGMAAKLEVIYEVNSVPAQLLVIVEFRERLLLVMM